MSFQYQQSNKSPSSHPQAINYQTCKTHLYKTEVTLIILRKFASVSQTTLKERKLQLLSWQEQEKSGNPKPQILWKIDT